MTRPLTRRATLPRTVTAGLALLACLGIASTVLAAPAAADARVGVRNDRGSAAADVTYRTPLTISGRGFQSVVGGFGGVYVMFGWVDDPGGSSWKPSHGGITGRDYRYIPDSESADNNGYLRFVAFPGSSTADEASTVMSRKGSFTVSLTVPGPVFQSVDRNGKVVSVDCRKVTCGVITIGAHGVQNPRNESFTRVPFTRVYDDQPTGGAQSPSSGPTHTDPSTQDDGEQGGLAGGQPGGPGNGGTTVEAGSTGRPDVEVERSTARAGNALAFTGTGFQPGEQVLAVFDDGAAALGPLVAGQAGEVAGVLQLPVDTGTGTHQLRLVAAASGARPVERFPVAPAQNMVVASVAAEPAAATPPWSTYFLVGATLLFVLALVWLTRRLVMRRSHRIASAS